MSAFKVGDRVRCVNNKSVSSHLREGSIYTVAVVGVAGASDDGYIGLVELDESAPEWMPHRFELAGAVCGPAPTIKPTTEKTPDGIDQHAPGAKLDAGKLRPALVLGGFANALLAVTKVGTDGAAKYTDNGWREVANGFKRYSDAEGRHRLYREAGETHDKLSGSLHLAHEAWNALAKLELYLMENPE